MKFIKVIEHNGEIYNIGDEIEVVFDNGVKADGKIISRQRRMSMTENESVLITLQNAIECATDDITKEDLEMMVKCLEELQQYRAIGTVEELEARKKSTLSAMELADIWCILEDLKKYSAIGTVEEFKALKEKNEPIANGEWIDTQPGYNNGYYKNVRVCSNCHDYYTTEYDEMKFCPKCGSKMTET